MVIGLSIALIGHHHSVRAFNSYDVDYVHFGVNAKWKDAIAQCV